MGHDDDGGDDELGSCSWASIMSLVSSPIKISQHAYLLL